MYVTYLPKPVYYIGTKVDRAVMEVSSDQIMFERSPGL